MKKVKLIKDVKIIGYGTIEKGTQFTVVKYNTRYVYVRLGLCELQLSRKDVEKVYQYKISKLTINNNKE